MAAIVIRHAEKKDVRDIHEIYSGATTYSGTLQLPFPRLSVWESRLDRSSEHNYSLVAEVEGKVVGQLGLHLEPNARRKHVAGIGMGVHEMHQGKGIGSQLVAAMIDLAENWLNLQRLELTVFTDNEPAIALYKKHGFVIEGESPKYGFRHGQYASVYHMARVQ